jgi:hypothetical protein
MRFISFGSIDQRSGVKMPIMMLDELRNRTFAHGFSVVKPQKYWILRTAESRPYFMYSSRLPPKAFSLLPFNISY